jgi:uncharacterized protein YdeI (YjbR/CyaY-like superfamily)
MGAEDPKVAAFFARDGRWQPELRALRALLQDSPLDEVFKWRSPCYCWQDANLLTLWGLKDACVLSFFKGVLLSDPEGMLVAPGAHSRSVRMLKFTDLAQIEAAAPQIRGFIAETLALEQAGVKVVLEPDALDWPEELSARLAEDDALAAAFEALTPGRQRGYLLHFTGAKLAQTRVDRIEKAVPRILAGKGMHDR